MKELIDKISEISITERMCTQHILREWKGCPPLINEKILINCHLTVATLILIEIFLFSGAEVKITCTNNLVCHEPIKRILVNLGIYISMDEILLSSNQQDFDIVLDCGAFLANDIIPRKAFIELTHVEASQYITRSCPVISVDNSFIKKIETIYGTGDGFVRAIQSVCAEKMDNFTDNHYMIFGYGKVGEGICSSLERVGVSKNNFVVVEADEHKISLAKSKGYMAFSIHQDLAQIKDILIDSIDCSVTVTGVKNCISAFLDSSYFMNVKYLANMGTYDEWGSAFSEDRILNQKQPLNFMLEYPTKILYLDPIFALFACATLDVLNESSFGSFRIQAPKLQTQEKVLHLWLMNEAISDIYGEMEQIWSASKENIIQKS